MPSIFWFYGLAGSGKTTAAYYAVNYMRLINYEGRACVHLDSDECRHKLWPAIDLTKEGRLTNTDRLCDLANMLLSQDVNVVISACAPYEEQRVSALNKINNIKFIRVDTPLDLCISRKPRAYGENNPFKVTSISELPAPYAVLNCVVSTEKAVRDIILKQLNKPKAPNGSTS